MLPHAVYGSAGGLANYRILAASAGVDEPARAKIEYYASLGGSALAAPFPPIFSFYRAAPELWSFARTVYLGPTSRGSDYLVHAILLDAASLWRLGGDPFRVADAGLFLSCKPVAGAVPAPLDWDGAAPPPPPAPTRAAADLAFSLRTLARGQLQLQVDGDAGAICRAIHTALPPSDRARVTFCTRFSYRRALDFRLAAFVDADRDLVREQAAASATVARFPVAASPGAADVYDRWVAEIAGQPELEVQGPSILDDAEQAVAMCRKVRQLRRWADDPAAPVEEAAIRDAAATVLRPENRSRPLLRPLLAAALAVELSGKVLAALATEQSLDETASLVDEVEPEVRAGAAQGVRALAAGPLEAWAAELLLALPDLAAEAVADRLVQRDRSGQRYLTTFGRRSRKAPRLLLGAVLRRVRLRFGAAGAVVVSRAAGALRDDRDALLELAGAAEKVALEAPAATADTWLLAMVRDIGLSGDDLLTLAARLAAAHGLLGRFSGAELVRLAPPLFDLFERRRATLAEGEPAALYAALSAVVQRRLRRDWRPSDAEGFEFVRRIVAGTAAAPRAGDGRTAADLTALVFLGATLLPHDGRRVVAAACVDAIEALVALGVSPIEAALLTRAVRRLSRAGAIRLHRSTVAALADADRRQPPPGLWNRLGWYLQVCTFREAQRA